MGVAIRVMTHFLSGDGQLCGCLQSIDERTPGHRARSGLNGSCVLAWIKGSGAIGERADWRRDDEFVYAARRQVLEHRSCRGLGASDIAGYPSRVLPEPDVDK